MSVRIRLHLIPCMGALYPINTGTQLGIGIIEFVLGFNLYIGLFICRSSATHCRATVVQTFGCWLIHLVVHEIHEYFP
jgi:hypothetical protein